MAYTICSSDALYIQNIKRVPMNKTSTQEFELSESLLKDALKMDFFPKPSTASLEFIRNFARNFRVQKNIEGDIREMVLN